MSTPKLRPGGADFSGTVECATRPVNEGTYKVSNRVLEWVTGDRFSLTNITDRIEEIVRQSGVREGLVQVQSLHTTTAVFLNEWQDALLQDMKACLEGLVERERPWRHNDPRFSDCERSNADSHLRGMLMGQSVCLQVRGGRILRGTWQSIIFAEFDGPRSRSLAVQVSGV
jgi:secondary thiamine-phosphate synthase enzyme